MWSWKKNKFQFEVSYLIESEMSIDLRDEATRLKARYNDPNDSLNATIAVLKHAPQFIHRTTSEYSIILHHLVR